MPLLIRLSEYMSIMIPSSLKIHQSRGQLHSGAAPAGLVSVESVCADFPSSASAPYKHSCWAKHKFGNLGISLPYSWKSNLWTFSPSKVPRQPAELVGCSTAGKPAWHWQCQELEVLRVPLEAGPHCSSPSPACVAALALLFFAQNHSNDAALTLSSSLCL